MIALQIGGIIRRTVIFYHFNIKMFFEFGVDLTATILLCSTIDLIRIII